MVPQSVNYPIALLWRHIHGVVPALKFPHLIIHSAGSCGPTRRTDSWSISAVILNPIPISAMVNHAMGSPTWIRGVEVGGKAEESSPGIEWWAMKEDLLNILRLNPSSETFSSFGQ